MRKKCEKLAVFILCGQKLFIKVGSNSEEKKSYYSIEPEYKVPAQEDCYKKRIKNLI
jgi:hypothetical protein